MIEKKEISNGVKKFTLVVLSLVFLFSAFSVFAKEVEILLAELLLG